jgi:hypothetical protein
MTSHPATTTAQFVPCSAKHKHCTKAHSELVWGYRVERRRQELDLEAITGGYAADKADYLARGGRPLITFKQWLAAHKRVEQAPAATVVVVEAEVVEAAIAAAERVVAEAAEALDQLDDADFWATLKSA